MYLGYQNNKIKFYTEQALNPVLYNLDEIRETSDIYVLDGEEYVKYDDKDWQGRSIKVEYGRASSK